MSAPHIDTAPGSHPDWCDPRACQSFPSGDVEHSTLPDRWKPRTDDVHVDFTVIDNVEWSRVEARAVSHSVGALVTVTHLDAMDVAGEPVQVRVFLGARELKALGARCLDAAVQVEDAEAGIIPPDGL